MKNLLLIWSVNLKEKNNPLKAKNANPPHVPHWSGTLLVKNYSEDSMTTLSEFGKLPLKENDQLYIVCQAA